MKTIRIKLYKFDELVVDAQQNAIKKAHEDVCTDYIYDDAYNTVKAFNEVFGTSEGRNSWLDVDTSNFDDAVLELKGFRLQKYLWNNYKDTLYKRKYLKHGELAAVKKAYHRMKKQTEITNNCPNKGKISVSYYSNIQKESKNCNLTGVCYDEDILDPIYDFLAKRHFSNCTIDFERLINDCFYELKKSIENEVDYQNSDEAITEDLIENDYDFTKNGQIY
jgi:hypothetical protein